MIKRARLTKAERAVLASTEGQRLRAKAIRQLDRLIAAQVAHSRIGTDHSAELVTDELEWVEEETGRLALWAHNVVRNDEEE